VWDALKGVKEEPVRKRQERGWTAGGKQAEKTATEGASRGHLIYTKKRKERSAGKRKHAGERKRKKRGDMGGVKFCGGGGIGVF